MKEKTDKILTLVLLGVSLITAVFAVIFALQSDSKHVMDGIRELGNNFSGMFDVAFWILVILLAIAICAIVVFLVKKLALRFKDEPGYLKKFLLLIGIIVVLLVVSFLLAKGTDVENLVGVENLQVDGNQLGILNLIECVRTQVDTDSSCDSSEEDHSTLEAVDVHCGVEETTNEQYERYGCNDKHDVTPAQLGLNGVLVKLVSRNSLLALQRNPYKQDDQ